MEDQKDYILNLLDNDDFIQWLIHPTPQSDQYWNEIMSNNEEQRIIITLLKKIVQSISVKEQSLSTEDKMLMWERVSSLTKDRQKRFRNKILIWSTSVAASLVLLAGGYLFWNQQQQKIDYSTIQAIDVQKQEKVQLITSNDQKLELEDDNVELVYDQQGKLNLLKESLEEDKPHKQLNQLIVPYGKTSSIILCDGTKVWVNSGSRLIYPSVFSKKEREIYIDGEIYLEVAHNKAVPFIVKTDQMDIDVLGTSFNVQAYSNTAIQSVVLADGAILVKNRTKKESLRLVPNEMYLYEKDKNESIVRKVDIYNYICWKYGFLHFDSEQIENVLERLERFYNITIHYNTETIKNILVSGKLDMKEELKDVLNSIALTAPIQFEITENNVYVKSRI